jgi:hypothetical protein
MVRPAFGATGGHAERNAQETDQYGYTVRELQQALPGC